MRKMPKMLEPAPVCSPRISQVGFWLVALCAPLSLLPVFHIPRSVAATLAARAPNLHFFIASLKPRQPGWLQYFSVQTVAFVLLLCAALACLRRGRDWWRPGRIGRQHVFLLALAAYVAWAVLGCFRAAWPYGAWRHVIRESAFYTLAAAAMLVCGTQKRWVTLAKVYVAGVLAATLLQEFIILQALSRPLTPLWTMATSHPFLFGIPLLLAVFGALGLAVSAAACWAAEEASARRMGCRWFLIAAAVCLTGLTLLLVGIGMEALPGLSGIMPNEDSWFRPLHQAFYRNAYMFGNMNLSAPIALTALYVTIALTFPQVGVLRRFLREDVATDAEVAGPHILSAALRIAAGLVAVGAFGLLFVCAGTLAGWVALAVSGWAFGVCALPPTRKKLQIALGVAPLALGSLVALTILGLPGLRARTLGALLAPDSTFHLRVVYWWAGTDMFLERPLTGWGAEAFPALFAKFRPPLASKLQFVQFTRPTHPHNEYMRLLCEHGLIGALCYMGALGVAFVSSFVTLRRKALRMRLLGYALWAGALAFCVQSTFGLSQKGWTFAISFWLLIGVLASAAHGLPEDTPPPKADSAPRRRIVAEGWVVLAIIASLLGWGWWEWGLGAWRSQVAASLSNTMRSRMNEASIFHPLFSQFTRSAERSRPRSLWPPLALYDDYVRAWTLTDKHMPGVAFNEAVFLQGQAPELLHTRLFMAQNRLAMGRIGEARIEAVEFIKLNPFAPRGYEVLADIDLPFCVDMLHRVTDAAEDDMAAQALRLPLARYAARLHQQLSMHRDPAAFVQSNPDSLAAHRLLRLLDDMTRWDAEAVRWWRNYVTNECTPAGLKALAAESATLYCKNLAGIRRVVKQADYRKQHGVIPAALAIGDVAPEAALALLGAAAAKQQAAVGAASQELRELGVEPPKSLMQLRGILRGLTANGNTTLTRTLTRLKNHETALLKTIAAMAQIADKRGDKRGAVHARAVLKLDPDNMPMWELLGRSSTAEAVRELTAHIKRIRVSRPTTTLTLCKLMVKLGKHDNKTIMATLTPAYDKSLKRVPIDVFRFMAEHDRTQAINRLRAYALRVPVSFGSGRAVDDLDRTARRWAAYAHNQPILSNKARKGFNEALHWLRFSEYRILLADLLTDAGQSGQAIRHILQCVALNPRNTSAWRVFFKIDVNMATERLARVVSELQLVPDTRLGAGTEAAHLPTLRLLLECHVRRGSSNAAVAELLDAAESRHGIQPYVLIVPAAARLAEDGLTELATQLRRRLTPVQTELAD
jgi:O-antigen ligase